ncbi:hypothetical protein P8452_33050 [Trifolium repens]|nr:hypothetical protein P8452_33050 [Trifolium repens]
MCTSETIVFDDLLSVNSIKEGGLFQVLVLRRWMVPDHTKPGMFSGVNVVGVVTSVIHDKNVFVHGGITETVRFKLNDESTSFLSELDGDYFVELAMSRGNRLVKSIKNVIRMFVNPATVVDVFNFRKRLIDYLTRDIRIFDKYIGIFHCNKCGLGKFIAGPKVKLTFKVDDEFGTELVKAFDDAFLNVVELNLFSNGISVDWFAFELVRVVDHPSVFSYYTDDGYVFIPSKRITSTVCSAAKPKRVVNPPPCTTTTTEIIRGYLNGSSDHLVDHNIVTRCVFE